MSKFKSHVGSIRKCRGWQGETAIKVKKKVRTYVVKSLGKPGEDNYRTPCKSKDPSTCNGEDFTWVNVIAKELFFCPGWVKVVVEGSKLRNVA